MISRETAVLTLGLGLLVGLPSGVGAADTTTDPSSPTVMLRGPFGSVTGSEPSDPAAAAPDDRPLDTWMREATLELTADPPLDSATVVSVTANAVDGTGSVQLPLAGHRWVTGPETVGEHVVVATVEQEGHTSQHAWLLTVPDRPGDLETLMQMPAVEAALVAESGTVIGERGHGCHVDMCQEVGHRPPAGALEPLEVSVGEPLTLELDDGSAIIHWEGRLEPQPGTASETRLAQATFDEPVAGPALTGLEPDLAGEWLLELRTDYDRQRGWQWYLFRLLAE